MVSCELVGAPFPVQFRQERFCLEGERLWFRWQRILHVWALHDYVLHWQAAESGSGCGCHWVTVTY